jgi:hypothetical protein
MLYNAIESAPSSEVVDNEITTRYYAQFDEQWFQFCERELVKINTFYNGMYMYRMLKKFDKIAYVRVCLYVVRHACINAYRFVCTSRHHVPNTK